MRHPDLKELQDWVRWIITDPRGVTEAMGNPHPSDSDLEPLRFTSVDRARVMGRYRAPSFDCLSAIEDSAWFARTDRISIYAEAYFVRVTQSLAADFSSIRRLVGNERFDQLVTDYLKEFPSQYENIGEVGRFFPDFLKRHQAGAAHPYIADLASLEWKIIESFHAEDIPHLDPEKLSSIPHEAWPEASFVIDPSVNLVESRWSIDLLWKEDRNEIMESARSLIVFRDAAGVHVEAVDRREFEVLRLAQSGKTLAEICSGLEDAESDRLSADIQRWFGEWIGRGVIRGVRC